MVGEVSAHMRSMETMTLAPSSATHLADGLEAQPYWLYIPTLIMFGIGFAITTQVFTLRNATEAAKARWAGTGALTLLAATLLPDAMSMAGITVPAGAAQTVGWLGAIVTTVALLVALQYLAGAITKPRTSGAS